MRIIMSEGANFAQTQKIWAAEKKIKLAIQTSKAEIQDSHTSVQTFTWLKLKLLISDEGLRKSENDISEIITSML